MSVVRRGASAERTAGIDLASQDALTAACVIEWPGRMPGRVIALERKVSDRRIIEIAADVRKIGFDVPLGWPRRFARGVARHSDTGKWDPRYDHARDLSAFRLRDTDRYFAETAREDGHVGVIPLSVSTDRIGVVAMRAAALLANVDNRGRLDGSGKVIEVYPAGSLLRWGLPYRQYKGAGEANRARRSALVDAFFQAAKPSLRATRAVITQCKASDDAFDALVAACVARAAMLKEVRPIPQKHRKAARREGWIAIPKKSALGNLAGPEPKPEPTPEELAIAVARAAPRANRPTNDAPARPLAPDVATVLSPVPAVTTRPVLPDVPSPTVAASGSEAPVAPDEAVQAPT
jgi:predicted nuclease with RNAse H fold